MNKKRIVIVILSAVLLIAAIGAVVYFSMTGLRNDPMPQPLTDDLSVSVQQTTETQTKTTEANRLSNGNRIDEENSKIVKFPYAIPDADLEITAIAAYSGAFVEDGSDEAVKNIMSITVKNVSDVPVNYALITISENAKIFEFELTTLAPGKSVLVMEKNREAFVKAKEYKYVSTVGTVRDSLTMDKNIKVSGVDGKLTIENLSDKEIKTAYVYYKNIGEKTDFVGGITYRTRFSNVAPNLKQTQETLHYSKTKSKIIMVEITE